MISKHFLEKFETGLTEIPSPGGGLHPALLGIANYGAMAGLTPGQIFVKLRQAIKPGKRHVPDQEIWAAIKRAAADYKDKLSSPSGASYHQYISPKPQPIINDGRVVLEKIIMSAPFYDETDLWSSSPICIDWPPEDDAPNFLFCLYEQEDLIFIGNSKERGILGQNIRTVCDWIRFFRSGGSAGPHFIINPLTGEPAQKKAADGETYRGDNNIKSFNYCLIEFDNRTRAEQIRFWSTIKLPVCALIDTGGKSIHGLVDVRKLASVKTFEQWIINIKNRLYDQCLIPLGVDSACSNPARLSRLPGLCRNETRNYQRLLWLSPEGRKVTI